MRESPQFTAIRGNQQSVVGLQCAIEAAQWHVFVSRIEVQNAAELRLADPRNKVRVVHAGRELNRQNHVIEAKVWWCVGVHGTTLRVYDHVVGVDADLFEHRAEERCLVLAVTVAVREHLGGGVRLETTNSKFDCYVADITLHKGRERAHLSRDCGFAGGEFGHFLLDSR